MKKLFPVLTLAVVCAAGIRGASAAPAVDPSDPLVNINTGKGTITVQVYRKEVPQTAANFLDLVKRGFYKNMVFHRVVKGFVIQTGDPTGTGQSGFIDPKTHTERRIKLEINRAFSHDGPGVLAMARTPDPDSASSQFYITLAPTTGLDGSYAIFGRVVKGMDVVNRIEQGDKFTSATLAGGSTPRRKTVVKKPAPAAKAHKK